MIYMFLAEGFEEIEAITPIDIIRRAGLNIRTVSVSDSLGVVGGQGITIMADKIFSEADFSDADMLILPGGGKGTENLAKHEGLKELLVDHNESGKYVAAICAAPTILGQLGMLKDKNATCYPGCEDKLVGAKINELAVILDGNIITSKGPGTAHNFGLKIVKTLLNSDIAKKLDEDMIFKRKLEVSIKERV